MATGSNTAANVTTTKGASGGYFFSAPITETPPTDYSTALSANFVCLGFITEDGVTESIEADSETVNDFGGDPIYVRTSSRTETIKVALAEVSPAALKEAYGQTMVTVDGGGDITVEHGGHDADERVYAIELVMRDGRQWRQVIPRGQVSAVDDLSLGIGKNAGRGITITALADSTGVSVYDYIEGLS